MDHPTLVYGLSEKEQKNLDEITRIDLTTHIESNILTKSPLANRFGVDEVFQICRKHATAQSYPSCRSGQHALEPEVC